MYLNVRLEDSPEEEKMMLDCRMRVELLQGQIHSFLQGIRELIVIILLCIAGAEQGSGAQQQQQNSCHLSPSVSNNEGNGERCKGPPTF